MALEELHLAFVLLGRSSTAECTEISSVSRLGIGFARVQPVLTGFEFTDHRCTSKATGCASVLALRLFRKRKLRARLTCRTLLVRRAASHPFLLARLRSR